MVHASSLLDPWVKLAIHFSSTWARSDDLIMIHPVGIYESVVMEMTGKAEKTGNSEIAEVM